MEIKTIELSGAALDWAVLTLEQHEDAAWYIDHKGRLMEEHGELSWTYQPSTDWSRGGPIIEREKLDVCIHKPTHQWCSATQSLVNRFARGYGPTPLIAAMRCYVTSKLGDNIDIPEELTK